MAVSSVVTKPDGEGGTYVLYWHHDQTADLWHRLPGQPTHCLIGRQILGLVRREMARRGISEDGWSPD
jgi:hypothetical protein